MKAGDNTLEALLLNLLIKTINSNRKLDPILYREGYIKFMTTPGTHDDTYANSCHRIFFTNWANKKLLDECPSLSNHSVDSLDGVVNAVPIILALHGSNT